MIDIRYIFYHWSEFLEDFFVLLALLVTLSFVVGCDLRGELFVEALHPLISLDFGLEWGRDLCKNIFTFF